jgi:predicted phosphodiesterase
MQRSFTQKIAFIVLFLALWGAGQTALFVADADAGIITPAQLNDYTSAVRVYVSPIEYFRFSGSYAGLISIHQPRSADIDGSLVVMVKGLPSGVTLLNASGSIDGVPYILHSRGFGRDNWAFVPVKFEAPARMRITFTTEVHQLVNGTVNARAVRALTTPFTIAALPDTQFYAEENNPGFLKQVEWVLANAASQNIAFVTHLGDVVDNGTDVAQWANVAPALSMLMDQSAVPFSIVRGNHDDPAFFLNNIPLATMQSKPWFIDADPSGLTQAQVFRVEGACILHIGFEKDPTADELAWVNDLLAKPELQGLPVIVSTHDYIDGSGQSPTGRIIWSEFVQNNPMVFMVLNGHTHTEYAVVNHDAANRPVFQMLSDYQDRANAGNGLMRLVTIDPAQSKIFVKTFSPYYNNAPANFFETDADSQFEYDVNVKERLAFDTTFDFGPEPPAPPLPALDLIPADIHYSHIFQNRRPLAGTDTIYTGTVDVQINENNANLNYGGEATLTTDMDDSSSRVQAFLRFDDIIGANPGQIPPGSNIISAKLVFNATSSTKGKVIMHRMLVPWSEHSTWMDFTPVDAGGQPSWESISYLNTDTGIYLWTTLPSVMVGGGVQANDAEAMAEVDATFTMPKPFPTPFILQPGGYGTTYQAPGKDPYTGLPAPKPAPENLTVDLTKAVQAWANGQLNYGWFFEPTSSDGWDFQTAEGKQPPALVVEVAGAPLVQ